MALHGGGLSMNNIVSLSVVAVSLFLLIAGWNKIRISYRVFIIASMILPLITTTLDSVPRYYMLIIPLYVVAARLLEKRPNAFYFVIITMAILQGFMIALFTRGYFIS